MRQTTHINASPTDIWPHLEDPVAMSFWHPKIVKVDHIVGSSDYTVDFTMSGKTRRFTSRIETSQPPQRLEMVHTSADDSSQRVRETFDLAPSGAGTEVRHDLDLSNAGIAWP